EIVRVLLAAMVSMFLGALDQSIVATALPSIGHDLNALTLLAWVISAYMLSMTAATPVVGKLSDIHGRKQTLRYCTIVFAASSVVCGSAKNMPLLVAGRLLQGLGGAGLITIAQATIADIVAPRERGRYVGYIAAVWGSSALIGPLLGGVLTEYLNWRWIFFINIPLAGIVLYLSEKRLPSRARAHLGARIAYIDAALFSAATAALLLGLSHGGVSFPWKSTPVLACFGGSALLVIVFAIRERRVAEPIIPPRFMVDPVTAPLFAVAFVVYGLYFTIAVLVPMYFQLGLDQAPTQAGAFLVPILLSNSVLALWSGHYVSRTGTYHLPAMLGFPMVIIALVVLGLFATQLTVTQSVSLLIVAGLGIGPMLPILNVVAQNAAPVEDTGAVIGALAFFRMVGGTVLSAAGTAVIMYRVNLDSSLADLVYTDPRLIPAATRLAVRSAFGEIFLGGAAALLVALIVFRMIEHRPLRSSRDTPSVDTD